MHFYCLQLYSDGERVINTNLHLQVGVIEHLNRISIGIHMLSPHGQQRLFMAPNH